MSGPRVFVCGELIVQSDAALLRESDFPARQGRRLWAYIVVNRHRPIGRDELADAVWGDDISESWSSGLNALASRMRARLRTLHVERELALQGSAGRYTLTLSADTYVDVERALSALNHAVAAWRRREPGEAWGEAVIAAAILGRGFLAGDDCKWIAAQRCSLAAAHLQALELTGQANLALGRYEEAEYVAQRIVGLEPLRESAYRLLVSALVAAGNRAQAQRVAVECRRMLRRDLGVVPSAETERCFSSVMPEMRV